MEFKNLKTDDVALMADLVVRAAGDQSQALASALRRIELVEDGRYGKGRPDVRLTIALAAGVEAAVDGRWPDRDASVSSLAREVEELVHEAGRIFNDRHNSIDMLKEVRATLSREVSKARRRGLPYRALDVSLTPSEMGSHDLPAVQIGIEVLGPMLDIERIVFDAESDDDVRRNFADMREKQEQRSAMREHLARVGADVMIDAVTLAALRDSGIEPSTVVAELRASNICIINVDVRHGRMPFYVRDCVMTGNVPLGDDMRWQDGRLIVPKKHGLAVKDAKGKPLNRLVAQDYFDEADKVDYVGEIGESVWLHIQPRTVALSLGTERKAA